MNRVPGADLAHRQAVAGQVQPVAQVGLDFGLPIIFGVLTTDTVEQAIDRAGTKSGNKGWQAAMSAVEMANLMGTVAQA